ncbi:MAG TPA: hypothetical protein VGW40_02875 [Allosphingosinicella sp.]|nr:hypothetical protein [Allosphingosinicella sp.]
MAQITAAHVIAARRTLYTRRLKEFVKACWSIIDPDPFIDNWHIDALCAHLEAAALPLGHPDRITRLLINIPPGTAKSLIVSVIFPAWLWARDPSIRIVSTSHAEHLAVRDTRKSRELITSDWFQGFWPTRLKDDQNQKKAYENAHKGFRIAKPFGSLTGERGNFLIVDDPHSVKNANSEADRTDAVDTMLTTAPNRLNDLTRDTIIVIMQRLHEEDISGVLLAKELGYVHLCIPMEYEGDKSVTAIGWSDPRTKDGELLFPKKFPAERIAELKSGMGPFAYAGQYQQRPAPKTDGFFNREWFQRYGPGSPIKDRPANLHYYLVSDHAPGGTATSDFNVFRIWGIDSNRGLWLCDSFRKQCEMPEALGVEIKDGKASLLATGALPMIRKWKPFCWFPERDGSWAAIKHLTEAFMRDTNTFCRIEPLAMTGLGDKINKAGAYRAIASMGHVYLPEGRIGDTALDEYVRFPNSKHDDQVDADAAIARVLSEAHPAMVPTVEQIEQPTDYQGEYRKIASDTETYF